MAEPLLTIGTFSRASLISIKALRRYHESGLLVPARVDTDTGYRAYHPAQLPDAQLIRRLRDLDVPLPDIRRILRAADPEVTRQVLAEHTERTRARLAETLATVAELQRCVQAPAEQTPVRVRDLAHEDVLALDGHVREEGFPAFFGAAFARLQEAARACGAAPAGPCGGLFPGHIAAEDQPVTAYLPVHPPLTAALPPGIALREVGGAAYAVTNHRGPYDGIDVAYGQLGVWAAYHHQIDPDRPVRERYLVSYADTDDPADFRTELCWPLRRA